MLHSLLHDVVLPYLHLPQEGPLLLTAPFEIIGVLGNEAKKILIIV